MLTPRACAHLQVVQGSSSSSAEEVTTSARLAGGDHGEPITEPRSVRLLFKSECVPILQLFRVLLVSRNQGRVTRAGREGQQPPSATTMRWPWGRRARGTTWTKLC